MPEKAPVFHETSSRPLENLWPRPVGNSRSKESWEPIETLNLHSAAALVQEVYLPKVGYVVGVYPY